jgi:DNA-binding LytR/AlgR family response regulator
LSVRPKHVRLIINGDAEPPIGAQLLDAEAAEPIASPDQRWPPQIIGEKSGRTYFLDALEVEYLASAGNYVVTHIGGNEFLTRATLKNMSEQLMPLGFVQIERSLLINLRRVAYVERHLRGQFCFVMRGGAQLVSSRERGASLRAFLLGPTSP